MKRTAGVWPAMGLKTGPQTASRTPAAKSAERYFPCVPNASPSRTLRNELLGLHPEVRSRTVRSRYYCESWLLC